jgi:small subunit ribosomal protein S1
MSKKENSKDLFGDDVTTQSESDFASLLDQSMTAGSRRVRAGDSFKGEILSIGKEEAFVSTGTAVDGAIPVRELLDDEKQMKYKVGDIIDVKVVRAREGEILLKRAGSLSSSDGVENLEDAFDMELPIEGRVTEAVKGGFRVEIQGKRAFCPVSQIDLRASADQTQYIGQKYDFIITQFEEKGRNIVVSRRRLLDLKKAESEGEFLEKTKPGTILQGKVTRLEKYGAFVALGSGVEGLVPISEIAWGRINHPSDVLTLGQEVSVNVIRVTEEEGRLRISLSIKTGGSETDPWLKIPERYPVGSIHEGTIERKETYGYFVNLGPGITGLLPRSKWRDRIDGGQYENKKKGDRLPVQVDEINLDDKKLTFGPPEDAQDGAWRTHAQMQKSGSLGTMADLLKDFKPAKK